MTHADSLLDRALGFGHSRTRDASIISRGNSWIRLVFKIGDRLAESHPRQKIMWQPWEAKSSTIFEAKLPSGFIGVRVSAIGKREATRKVVTMLSHCFLSNGCRCVELCLLTRAKLRPGWRKRLNRRHLRSPQTLEGIRRFRQAKNEGILRMQYYRGARKMTSLNPQQVWALIP